MIDERYSRQIIMSEIGEAGQELLQKSRVAIIGIGALGTVIANNLTRAGVGYLRLIDRDYVDLSNLQRQSLFCESDIKNNLPKAVAASQHLNEINSTIQIEPIVRDVNHANIEELLAKVDLVLDGTDNFATRFIINDACSKKGLPWIYGSALGGYGMTMNIIPGQTACFRCVFGNSPASGDLPTCSTVGVMNMIIGIIGCYQSSEALKMLIKSRAYRKKGLVIDLWRNLADYLHVPQEKECLTCVKHEYEFLQGKLNSSITNLCGSDSIQVMPAVPGRIDLQALGQKLGRIGSVSSNKFLLKYTDKDTELTLFADGRAIIKNVQDEQKARAIYAKYIGH